MVKKFLFSLLLAICPIMASAQTTMLNGDLNHDGKMTMADLTRLIDIILGKEPAEILTGNISILEVPYVTFKADGSQTLKMTKNIPSMQYSLKGGAWKTLGTNTIEFGGSKGDIRLRAISPTGTATSKDSYSTFVFGTEEPVACSGDIRTLVDFTNYINADCSQARFCNLFKNCTALTSAPELPMTELVDYCYYCMFYGCTSLTKGPDLPALKLVEYCYYNLFRGCTSLMRVKMLATDVSAPNSHGSWLGSVAQGGVIVKNPAATWNWDGMISTGWLMEQDGYFNNGHAYVDLGLTSGTKWATVNVNGMKQTDKGGHYAWGEFTKKTIYSWDNYKYCKGTGKTITKYGVDDTYGVVDNLTKLEASDDVATIAYGTKWHMPDRNQFEELLTECDYKIVTISGTKCFKFTSRKNYNYIVLPCAGRYEDGNADIVSDNVSGFYWSRDLYTTPGKVYSFAHYMRITSDVINDGAEPMLVRDRCYGMSVRPVMDK